MEAVPQVKRVKIMFVCLPLPSARTALSRRSVPMEVPFVPPIPVRNVKPNAKLENVVRFLIIVEASCPVPPVLKDFPV